jgi:hypothetical protein
MNQSKENAPFNHEEEEGLLYVTLNWGLAKDQSTAEDIESEVKNKLEKIKQVVASGNPSTLILWSYGIEPDSTEEIYLNSPIHPSSIDIRTVKSIPPVEDDEKLKPKAFIELMKQLEVNENAYQNPKLHENTDFLTYRNKIMPTNIPNVFFHVAQEILPVGYSVEVAFLTTGIDFRKLVSLKYGEKPRRINFIQKILTR